MSKVKKNTAPHYELLYLVSNQFSEEELTPVKERVLGFITANGGTVTHNDDLGKKRLAYKIKQFRHGYYQLLEFDAPAEAAPKIDHQLRLASEILRHQLVKCQPKTAADLEKEAAVMKKLTTIEEVKPEEAPKPPAAAAGEEKKIELSDLDDKLNQILDAQNLI